VLLAGPGCSELHTPLTELLLGMQDNAADGGRVLSALGLQAWERQDQEDTEFMIDLMDTLMR
jgi:phosphonate transport system substrate-binding protein